MLDRASSSLDIGLHVAVVWARQRYATDPKRRLPRRIAFQGTELLKAKKQHSIAEGERGKEKENVPLVVNEVFQVIVILQRRLS